MNATTQSEWNGFPAMGVPEVDELGFKRVTDRLGEFSPYGRGNDISIGCSRAAAVLRALRDGFTNFKLTDQDRNDIACLIEMALETVPETDADQLTNHIYRANREAEGVIRGLMLEDNALRLMLKAMEVAGRASSTLEEIERAAATAHACAHVLPGGENILLDFVCVVESRGMAVEWLSCGERLPLWPKVHASQAALKKVKRPKKGHRGIMNEFLRQTTIEDKTTRA